MMPHIELYFSSGTGLIIQLVETMRFRHGMKHLLMQDTVDWESNLLI
jgi:hypothetical protein